MMPAAYLLILFISSTVKLTASHIQSNKLKIEHAVSSHNPVFITG